MFVRCSAAEREALRAQGFGFYDWGAGRRALRGRLGHQRRGCRGALARAIARAVSEHGRTAASAAAAGDPLPFVLVALIWGSTWFVIKDQLAAAPPSWSVAYRFAIACAGDVRARRVSAGRRCG